MRLTFLNIYNENQRHRYSSGWLERAISDKTDLNVHTARSRLKQRNRIRVHIDVRTIKRIAGPVNRNHVRRADRAQTVNIDIRVRALEAEDVVLAVFGTAAVGASFIEGLV